MDERWGKRLSLAPVSWCDCESVGRSGTKEKDSHRKASSPPEHTDEEEEPEDSGSGSGSGNGGGRMADTALERLSLEKLIAKDPPELRRLFAASRDLGAFYLDLRRAGLGEKTLSAANELFRVGADLFDLPEDAKRDYDMSRFGGHYGYKGYCNRTRDFKEFYTVSKDDILSIPPAARDSASSSSRRSEERPQPGPVRKAQPLLESYIYSAHEISSLLLRLLAGLLQLPDNTLEDLHSLDARSGDQVRWIKIQPSQEPRVDAVDEVLLDEHSDSNTVTVLFNRSPGLQVRVPQVRQCQTLQKLEKLKTATTTTSSPRAAWRRRQGRAAGMGSTSEKEEEEEDTPAARWVSAEPIPGHCVVHFGEQIANLTHGVCRPSIHRVRVPPRRGGEAPMPAAAGGGDGSSRPARYSLVYFARPEDEVILQQLGGVSIVPRPPVLDQDCQLRASAADDGNDAGRRRTEWMWRWTRRKREG